MKSIFYIILLLVNCSFANAKSLKESSAGTFVIMKMDNKSEPSDLLLRLTKEDSAWRIEGRKTFESEWQDISCSSGCELSESSDEEMHKYFNADFFLKFNIGCLENESFAFCELSLKENQAKETFVFIAFVGENYFPAFVNRAQIE